MDFLRYLPADLRKVECTVTGSCPATAEVDHTRSQIPPWRHKTGSSFPGWCSVSNTRFLDDIRLSEAGPVDFRRIPPWRHQTGSSFPEWFPVLPTCFSGCPRPPEARPILRNIKHRSGILLPVCCRHAGFSTKSSSRTSTSTNISWDPSRTPATASTPMAHSKILRIETW